MQLCTEYFAPFSHAAMQPCCHAAMLPCSQTIIYENLTTNCKCMLCHCTSKPTEGMAKMFMAIRSGCQENQDLQDEATNPEVGGRISRTATNGKTSSHRQQQQSQLYQQLAEHEEHCAKIMTNSAIRNSSDHPAGRQERPALTRRAVDGSWAAHATAPTDTQLDLMVTSYAPP
jgi:hypothetical protein